MALNNWRLPPCGVESIEKDSRLASMIHLITRENSTDIEVCLSGSLTKHEVKDAFNQLQPVWQTAGAIVLDLSAVTDLDATGFQLLIYWKLQAVSRGKRLRIENHSAPVLAALNSAGARA